jgi:hypothetical protein
LRPLKSRAFHGALFRQLRRQLCSGEVSGPELWLWWGEANPALLLNLSHQDVKSVTDFSIDG